MSQKKPLVKQRMIKSSSIEEIPSDDDIISTGKHSFNTTLDRKRVSFKNTFERPTTNIEDSDSDEENSLGRHNRPGKRAGFDSLFRSSGEGSDAVQTKTEKIEERSRGKNEAQRPRPVPRRHGSSIQQSTEEERHKDPPASRTQPDKPVPRLRSPRQQPEAKEAAVPKPRPRLSPRGNSPRLGGVGNSGADVIDGPKERPMVPSRKKSEERKNSGPQIPMIKTPDDDETETYKHTQGRGMVQKRGSTLEKKSSVPAFELSESSDEDEESRLVQGNLGLSSNMHGRQRFAKDVDKQSPGRQPKPLPRGHLSPRGVSKEEEFVDDSENLLQQKRHMRSTSASHINSKEEIKAKQGRAGSPGFESARTPERRSVKTTKEKHASKEDAEYETAQRKNSRFKTWDSEDDSDTEILVHEKDRARRRSLERDLQSETSPGRINRVGRKDRPGDQNVQSEDPKERPRSARDSTPLHRSSSFDGKLTPSQRQLAGAEGARNAHSRQSPLPQRPASAKNKLYRTLGRDVTATFEEHVPQEDNVIEVDDEFYRKKANASFREQGSMRAMTESTPKRGGPMKASRGIDEMTRSAKLRKELKTQGQNESTFSPGRSLGQKRASSMTDLRGRAPSPINYASDDDIMVRQNSLDTGTIRQAVFDDWMSKKNERLKKEMAKKTAARKKQEEKEKEEQMEKRNGAKRAFESWSEKKSSVLKEQQSKQKEKKKQEEDKELEKQIKKRDAKKFFDSWKAKKDEELKEAHHKKKQEEVKNKKRDEDDKQENSVSSSKVYDNWKQKKDDKIKQEVKEKRKKERAEAQQKEDEEYEKSLERADKLETWKQKKGTPRKGPPPPTLTQRAWCPGSRNNGNCIPSQVSPVIQSSSPNRSRTLSSSERLRSSKYDF